MSTQDQRLEQFPGMIYFKINVGKEVEFLQLFRLVIFWLLKREHRFLYYESHCYKNVCVCVFIFSQSMMNLKNQKREVNSSIKFISTLHHVKWWWLLSMKQWSPYMFPRSGMTSALNFMPHSGHWRCTTLQFHIPATNGKSINLKSRWKPLMTIRKW